MMSTVMSRDADVESQGIIMCTWYWYNWMVKVHVLYRFNPLCTKFSRGNINIYLHIMPLFHIDLTQVVKILDQEPTYST